MTASAGAASTDVSDTSHANHENDPWCVNADLHCHSGFSDGVLTPEQVVRRAHSNGVQLLALTNHDELGGLEQAQAVADSLQLPFVAGVEISVTWAGKTIHIVGLGINRNDPQLVAALTALRAGRDARARAMADALEQATGISGAYEGALAQVTNQSLILRTHFARYLVSIGVCKHTSDVFQRFLVPGKPGFVDHCWARLGDAVGWIATAGGQAVIAHPGRYRLDDTALWALMNEFREAGGVGVEVVTGSHTKDQYLRFARIAREFEFCASRGSDFHSPTESRVDLGQLPPLPDTVLPVWHNWSVAPVASRDRQ